MRWTRLQVFGSTLAASSARCWNSRSLRRSAARLRLVQAPAHRTKARLGSRGGDRCEAKYVQLTSGSQQRLGKDAQPGCPVGIISQVSVRAHGAHSLRRTKASMIDQRTGNLRAVHLLLGHSKIESAVRYLAIAVDDTLLITEQVEIKRRRRPAGEPPQSPLPATKQGPDLRLEQPQDKRPRCARSGPSNSRDHAGSLLGRLRLRKRPGSVKDLLTRAVQPHRVVPARHDRQAVRRLLLAAPELDRVGAIRTGFRGKVVQ